MNPISVITVLDFPESHILSPSTATSWPNTPEGQSAAFQHFAALVNEEKGQDEIITPEEMQSYWSDGLFESHGSAVMMVQS